MKRTWMRGLAGACVAIAMGGGGLAAQDTFEWSGRVAAGGALKVKGISGTIRAEAGTGTAVRVTAAKTGRQADFGQVDIRMEQDGDDVVICAVYGSVDRSDGCASPASGGGRAERNRSIDVAVDFVVQLPAGTPLHASMISGDVTAQGLRSDVHATTVSGDVAVSTSGVARASTVSGSVNVAMGSADWKELDFSTVSGDITLRMPASLSADLNVTSVSGDFDSDFDITVRGRTGRRWVGTAVRGTIGDGGRSLSVKSVSGDVRLVRGG